MNTSRTLGLLVVVGLGSVGTGCEKGSHGPNAAGSASAASSSARGSSGSAGSSAASATAATSAHATKLAETLAGTVSQVGDEIRLESKTIYPPPACSADAKDGCAKVKALREGMEGVKHLGSFASPAGGPNSVLLFQVTTAGNACNGGPLFFVGFENGVPPRYSDVFDHCGGPDPTVVALSDDRIMVHVPAHPANRGTDTIKVKTAYYDVRTGALTAVPYPKVVVDKY